MWFSSKAIKFLIVASAATVASCFQNQQLSHNNKPILVNSNSLAVQQTSAEKINHDRRTTESSTSLNMFMGSDGGILGIGGPELATILLVGYFVLGPSDLYKLTKEIGKFIQNVRTLGSEATKTFEDSMENQLQFEEIRKAQRELNDAFSFRKSINSDENANAFERLETPPPPSTPTETTVAEPAAAAAVAAAPKKPKRRRRVKKKQPVVEEEVPAATTATTMTAPPVESNVPDLSMNDAIMENNNNNQKTAPTPQPYDAPGSDWFDDEPMAQPVATKTSTTAPWLDEEPKAATTPSLVEPTSTQDKLEAAAAQERFQQQLTQDWNNRVLQNEDKLEPLAMIMQRLALLEEEKNAADLRLKAEFRERAELEEFYYREKRELLEEAATEVQKDAII